MVVLFLAWNVPEGDEREGERERESGRGRVFLIAVSGFSVTLLLASLSISPSQDHLFLVFSCLTAAHAFPLNTTLSDRR